MKTIEKILYIDLQLCAEQVINTTESAGLSPAMKTYYDKNVLRMAKPKLVHAQFGQKRPIPKNGGKKIEFRRYASLPKATTPLTEGVTPPGQTMEVLTVEATLKQYGDYIKLTDVVSLTAIDNELVEATNLCGAQGGQTMDTVVRDIMHTGTNVFYAPKVVDGVETEITDRADLTEDCQITCDVVDQVVAFLRAQNAPPMEDGYYVGIIHPYAAYDLKKDPNWRKPKEYCDPQDLYKGEIGEYGGVRFVDSSEAKIYAGEGCPAGLSVFGTLIIGDNAYGTVDIEGQEAGENLEVIVKPVGSGGSEDPLNQRGSAGWKALETAAVLIENYMVRIESCSKKYSKQAAAN